LWIWSVGVTFHRYGLGGFDGDMPVDNATRTYIDKGAGSPTIAIKRLETIMKVNFSNDCQVCENSLYALFPLAFHDCTFI
jgi:hypothetical protein